MGGWTPAKGIITLRNPSSHPAIHPRVGALLSCLRTPQSFLCYQPLRSTHSRSLDCLRDARQKWFAAISSGYFGGRPIEK